MDFYILPERKAECERKLELMFKHWEVKPTIEFGNVEKVVSRTLYDYGSDGSELVKYTFDAVKVTIGDMEAEELVLVAEVLYNENIVTVVNAKYYKDMPKEFGLLYDKCDYCGGTHTKRIKSYILYNKNTHEYKQIGSTCFNKVFAKCKYLGSIIEKLSYYIKISIGGCDEEGWHGGWYAPDNTWKKAIRFDMAIAACVDYIKENGEVEWIKPEYDKVRKIKSGTNDFLQDHFSGQKEWKVKRALYERIKKFYDNKEGKTDEYGEPDMTQKIKNAFVDEWIKSGEMYLAFFALKSYNASLTAPDWLKAIEDAGIVKGEKYDFVGNINITVYSGYDEYYGAWEEIIAKGKDEKSGLMFVKQLSHKNVCEPYKREDGKYAFTCKVVWINNNKREIKLGGRLSATKIKKSKKV